MIIIIQKQSIERKKENRGNIHTVNKCTFVTVLCVFIEQKIEKKKEDKIAFCVCTATAATVIHISIPCVFISINWF